MIDSLPNLAAFARIVSAGSLSAAARELDISLAVVSKRLAQLEKSLGVRLIQRTTRRQTLTEEGALFYARVVRILAEVEEAEALISRRRGTVGGLLRLSAPRAFGRQWVAPIVSDFQRLHPRLSVQLELTDTVIDLLENGADMAIRFGSLADSSLIARQLAPNYRVLCAAPAYLKKYGVPKHPDELVGHRCIIMRDQPWTDWRFENGDPMTVRVTGPLLSNDGSAAHTWALEGAGIVLKSIWDVGDDIAAGRLRRVLPKYRISSAPLHAIYPHSRHLAPRVRAFVEYLVERLREAWRWDEG
jgi:DNA-binding transcriptional LysR family regulator